MCEPQSEKELWLQLLEAYKKNDILWDPKHERYNNKYFRSDAYEELWEIYKKIYRNATVVDMCKRLRNMKKNFIKEKEKVLKSKAEKGNYAPSLWYFDLFTFLDPESESLHFNTMKYFDQRATPSTWKRTGPIRTSGRLKRPRSIVIKEEVQTDEQEVISPSVSRNQETHRSEAPKRRIYNLLQKQERFIDTVSRSFSQKTEAWEVQGKAIGLQLNKIQGKQRTIAEKLISDVIYFGSMGKLTENAAVNMNDTVVNGNDAVVNGNDAVVNVHVKQGDTDIEEEEYLEYDALGEDDE